MGEYTSVEDEEFFGAIGRLAISWGHLEVGLDCMIEIMHLCLAPDQVAQEIPRVSFIRKINYLRAAFKKTPLPSDALQGYLSLFDEIETALTSRHDIIHGVVIDHIERSGEATIARLVRQKDGSVSKRFLKVSTLDILKAARDAQKLGSKTLYFVNSFYDLVRELSRQRGEQSRS